MRILHVTPHLGGGVGKAHAAIGQALPKAIERTFVLLEPPRDPRYAAMIEAGGAVVIVARSLDNVADLAAGADIVQFEFWNHPRLFECLARTPFPAMRSVFWSHTSGLFRPVIQPGLIEQSGRFVFSTEASYAARGCELLPQAARQKLAVINSGFGFTDRPMRARPRRRPPAIAYLGTVDFVKMHRGFFDAIDRLDGDDIRVDVWGAVAGPVAAQARAMRHPERIRFGGETAAPAAALSDAEIFFYPLQREHYGTAENALVEAMSLGLVPVVLDNPAELAIVQHGTTGYVGHCIDDCAGGLQKLLFTADVLECMSSHAIRHIAETRTPARSAHAFFSLWRDLLSEPARRADFRSVIGDNPAEWFIATQCLPGEPWRPPPAAIQPEQPVKGMLAHFESAFPCDPSLSRLAGTPVSA
jgi:glycosyltransferase involved in cell wall biosynthesis